MKREDIIRIAEHSGFGMSIQVFQFSAEELERFAALVAAEKDKEIERLRDALKWSRDVDCGCCSDCIEPPDEFRDLVEWADEIKRGKPL